MRFDIGELITKVEKASPRFSKKLSTTLLNLTSPFNGHLKLKMLNWSDSGAKLQLRNHRAVRNHVGGIHAGALFTLGETCAGLTIIRNFNFKEYRPILSHISADFFKQARKTVIGESFIQKNDVHNIKRGLNDGEPQFIEMHTEIKNEDDEVLAKVNTTWQIKSWAQVKTK